MAQRSIVECDRCHHEIKSEHHTVQITGVKREISDLCDSCRRDLEAFLDGQELEVPP